MSFLKRIIRLYHTLIYLKPVQIYGRIWFRLYRPRPSMGQPPALRQQVGQWGMPVSKPSSLLSPWKFRFLNKEHECCFPDDWNSEKLEKLWLYNLHYFDTLQSDAGKPGQEDLHRQLIGHWIAGNPIGFGNGWEPYPISLRIVNWIKWALNGNRLPEDAVHSIAVQARYLARRIEYHLQGNHLLANAKALIFAGAFFGGKEADGWLDDGARMLKKELNEQILGDGGHFERSPMYHAIILEDVLDLINVGQVYGALLGHGMTETVRKMCSWLSALTHPDQRIVLFNDSAFGIASDPENLFGYAERLGIRMEKRSVTGLNHFQETGYVVWKQKNVACYMDVAPVGPDYLPGHGHADTLGFELSLFGKRFLVDSGTSCYGGSAERLRQRGTAAHNTVVIDGCDSSEVWGGFRVARRARPFGLEVNGHGDRCSVKCSHDGYKRLSGRPVHERKWQFDYESLAITDSIQGAYGEVVIYFHFHPEIEVTSDHGQGKAVLPSGKIVSWVIRGGKCELKQTTYHPEFGVSQPNRCLVVTLDGNQCESMFFWGN